MSKQSYFDWVESAFDPAQIFGKPEALAGIRVLELATIVLGPATSGYLAEYGAEVIKLELPNAGETIRYVAYEGTYWRNATAALFPANHNKYWVGLDVHEPEGKELFLRLASRSDVVLENFRAGTLDRWGVGYRQLREIKPDIIYVANSGFGQWGPFSTGRPSYDLVAQALSGMAAISGFPDRPPSKAGFWAGDWLGACLSAVAVLAALHHRQRTGEGQFIDFSQAEGLFRAMDWTWLYRTLRGRDRQPSGNRDLAICPNDIFACQNGFVALAAFRPNEFRGLCQAMGQPNLADDPRFATPAGRLKEENATTLLAEIAVWAGEKTSAELESLGSRYGFAAVPVMDFRQQYEDAHLRHRGTVWAMNDPLYGPMVEPGPVAKMSKTPGRLKWLARPVGWHNEYIFGELLGLSRAQLTALEERNIVGRWGEPFCTQPPDDWDGQAGTMPASFTPHTDGHELPLTLWETVSSVHSDVPWSVWIAERTDPHAAQDKPEALDDLLVLDLSEGHFGGLVCSSMLAEFGARVIRVEPPGGDIARQMSPYGDLHRGTGLPYLIEGRNKEHITLDLEQPEGRRRLRKLAEQADVLIETFLPGKMDKWGIGYRHLAARNPRLIYVALHVHGQFGPRARCKQPDYDVVNQALSGAVWATGEMADPDHPQPYQVPTRLGSWFGWFSGGTWATFGVLAALHHRSQTGEGQMLDVSGAEGIMHFMDYYLTLYHTSRIVRERNGPLDPAVFPYTFVRCKDGYAVLAGYTDPNFAAICTIMERPDLLEDPRFASTGQRTRLENEIALHPILEAWARDYTAQEILDKANDHMRNKRGPGLIVTGPVVTPGMALDETNWWERGVFQKVRDADYGELVVQGPVWKMSASPPRLKWLCRPLGADNEQVYSGLLRLRSSEIENS